MKKRSLLTLMLIAILAFSLGLGTMAYYKKTFTSSNNSVRFAKFTVDTKGTLNEEIEFDIPDPIIPGYENDEIHKFIIDKTGTEVPVEYDIKVTPTGGAFGENSPVDLTLYNKVNNEWVPMEDIVALNFKPDSDVEEFKLGLKWGHKENDIDFQGLEGNIKIEVIATQVDEPQEEPEPDPDPDSDIEIIKAAKAHLIELGDNGLTIAYPTSYDFVKIRRMSSINEAIYTFSEEFEYDESERINGRISRRSSTEEGVIYEIQAKRDTNVDYTARVKLEIKKGEAMDFVTYEVFVPKDGVRKNPITGEQGIPPEALTIKLLP